MAKQTLPSGDRAPTAHTHATASVRLGGIEIFYRSFGKPGGTPVLIAHGMSYFSYDWIEIASALATDRQIVALDQRGFGNSGWSTDQDYAVTAFADDMINLLDHLQWNRVILMGHSMGGAKFGVLRPHTILIASRRWFWWTGRRKRRPRGRNVSARKIQDCPTHLRRTMTLSRISSMIRRCEITLTCGPDSTNFLCRSMVGLPLNGIHFFATKAARRSLPVAHRVWFRIVTAWICGMCFDGSNVRPWFLEDGNRICSPPTLLRM